MPIPHGKNQRSAIRISITKLCLSTAILSVLGAPAMAQAVVADGTTAVIPADTAIVTNGQYAAGAGLHALNGGSIVSSGPLSISATNLNAYAVYAQSGGTIDISGATISSNRGNVIGAFANGAGSHIRLSDSTISLSAARGMRAQAGGSIEANNVNISNNGANNAGVNVTDTGTLVIYNGGSITTGGANSYGIDALNQSRVETNDVTIKTSGNGAYGLRSSDKGTAIIATGGTVTTTGTGAAGILVRTGGSVEANNVDINTSGGTAIGAWAAGGGSTLKYTGGSITTNGIAYAFSIDNGAQLEASDVVIDTSGLNSVGLMATGSSIASITGSSIVTRGENARGVIAQYAANVSVSDTTISTAGNTASGPSITTGGIMEAINTNVVTKGERSFGLRANGESSQANVSGGSYRTDGVGSNAISAVNNALVNISHEDAAQNTRITTTGEQAAGIHAESGATINASGVDLRTLGNGSHAVVAETGSTINLVGGGFNPLGIGAHGVVASGGSTVTMAGSIFQVFGEDGHGISLADDSTIVADNSYISSYASALKTESGNAVYDLRNGTTVVGTYGTVLTGAAGSNTTLKADDRVALSGDMIAEASDTVIDASLSNNSRWFGAAKGVTTVAVDGTSYWLMTGSSDVGLLTNDGTVEFDAANPYKTLTAATLNVNGGSFILNTKLNEGGAASETDKIVVTGDANGTGMISIRNNGGTGAFTGNGTTDGIQVVQVGGASDAEFQLGSAAVVGIYGYQLKKADGQNWYLQTEGDDVVDPGDGSGGNPGPGNPGGGDNGSGGENPGTGHVVDIVPGYNIALSAAQNHVLTTLDTFHERLGELRSEDLQDGFHAWMRGIGKTGSYSPKSITGYNGHGFDMTTAGVQIGADYSKGDVFVAGDKLTVGIFGEYANSSFDVRGRTADGSISSKGLGGYVTWQQKAPTDRKPGTGAYVDAVVKQDWLDFGVNAKSVSGFDLRNGYKGKATSASIEAGYGFDLGNNVVLQPQAQLTWSKIKADSFTDPYGIAVHGQEAESLIGRVGVRLEKTFYFGGEEETLEAAPAKPMKPAKNAKGKKGAKAKTVIAPLPDAPKKKKFVKSVTTYADANVRREFKGKNGLVASGTGIGNDMGGTRYDVGVGVVARVSENVSLFGRGAVEFGGSTNVAGKVSGGLKITW